MFRLPKNHPFFYFEEIKTDESVMISLSFQNVKVDGVSLYDKFGGVTARQTIPLAVVDNFAVGKSVIDDTKAQVCKALVNDFISNYIHEDTIEDRFKTQLFYREKDDESGDIKWDAVIHFVYLFIKDLTFLDFKSTIKDGVFYFVVKPKGDEWVGDDGFPAPRPQGVFIPFKMDDCVALCNSVYDSSMFERPVDKLIEANDSFKMFIFSQFTNWMFHAKSDNIIQVA